MSFIFGHHKVTVGTDILNTETKLNKTNFCREPQICRDLHKIKFKFQMTLYMNEYSVQIQKGEDRV